MGADDGASGCAQTTASWRCRIRPVPYVIAAGDRLSRLARQYEIDVAAIEAYNAALENCDMAVGDVITLPLRAGQGLAEEEACREIRRGIRGQSRITLTFDAGGEVGALDALLDTLRDRGVRATFFITGRWVERYPDAFQRILEARHEVFSHSYTHRPFTRLSREQILEELQKTERAFREAGAPSSGPYFRPPYGDRDRRVLEIVGQAGYRTVYWTYDSLDSVGRPKSRRQLIERVFTRGGDDSFRDLDGAIFLFHVSPKTTAQAVGPIIDRLRENGLEPVPLTRLLKPVRLPREPRLAPLSVVGESEPLPVSEQDGVAERPGF